MPDISLRRVDQSTAKPKLIVIFIHGLGGDPVSTWCHTGGEADGYFWPRGIAEKIEGCAVFTLGYPADKAVWNTGWPIATAAVSVLDKLMSSQRLRECGDVPIAFVCHSLGGLIIKKLVVTAHLDRQQQPAKGEFLDRIAGVVFLATPHSGSIIANIVSTAHWFVTNSLTDLKASDANLLDLSHSYRERIINGEARIRHRVYYETEAYGVFKIVSPASADLGVPGTRPIGVKRHHMSICKPLDEEDRVYEGVLTFLQDEVLLPRAPSQTEKMDALPDAVADKVAEKLVAELDRREEIKAAQSSGVERFAIVQLAKRIGRDVKDFDQALLELERAVEIAIKVQAEGARGSNNGDFVDDVLRRVAELSAKGKHRDAGTEADKAFAQWERDEAERQEAALQAGVKLLDAGINQALLDRNATTTAQRIARKCDLQTPDPNARFGALRLAQDEWYSRGCDKGLNLDLEVATEIARIELFLSQGQDERWEALNNLGNSLQSLGKRDSDTKRLEEAVAAYRLALEVKSRDREPQQWATTQCNLGAALRELGSRGTGTLRLEEAVSAHRSALAEFRQDSTPLDWAMTQNNLGAALWALGEREKGTSRLGEAIIAYREALKEYRRDNKPLQWATTQNNLGGALNLFASRASCTQCLKEAVIAFRAALEERTRDDVPLDWAGTQNNLGIALQHLGLRESNRSVVKEAIEAFHAALEEYSRDRTPPQWAGAQNNLGAALIILGLDEIGTSSLTEAVTAFDAALEERTRDRVPFNWAMSFGNQGIAKMKIAERSSDRTLAHRALRQIQAAFNEMKAGGHEPLADYFQARSEEAERLIWVLESTILTSPAPLQSPCA